MLSASDITALFLTLKLALVTTFVLMVVSIAIAYWLANTKSMAKQPVLAIVALPMVLPPTVIGFYVLLMLGSDGWVGQLGHALGFKSLNFTFTGIVIASVIYSLPFGVQPIQIAFESIDKTQYDVAQAMGANRLHRFWSVTLPQSRLGLLTAAMMVFAHTLGEFGVVLMVGGNIPGVSRVVSIQIYDHVESLNYASAHQLSWVMLGLSFAILLAMYLLPKFLVPKYSTPKSLQSGYSHDQV